MTNTLSQRAQALARRPLVKRGAIGLGVFLVLFGLFGYFVLPGIIKGQAEKIVSEKLHRTLHLGKVEVSPYALAVTLRDLKLMEADGETVFVGFDALTVNVAASSLFRLAPVVQEVRLQKPYVHLVRQDANHYNFDDLLKGGDEKPAEPAASPRFAVHNIQIEDGRLAFEDKPAGKSHAIEELKLGIPFISSLPSQVEVFVEPLLSAKVNGTPLLIKGKARPFAEPREAVVDLDLDGVDIPAYLGYLPFKPNFKLPSARLDVHLNVSFQQPRDKAPNLLLGGQVSLKDVKLNEISGKPILKLPELAVTLGKTDLTAGHLDIEKIALTGIEAEIVKHADGKLNVLGLVPASKATPPAKAAAKAVDGAPSAPAAGPALTLSLGELELRSAALRFSDEQVAHPLNAGVEKFDLAVRKVEVDTGKHSVSVGEITSASAAFLLVQGKAGTPAVAAADAGGDAAEKADGAKTDVKGGAGYAITIARVAIQDWAARLEDRNLPQAAVTLVSPLGISAESLSTAAGSAPGKVEIKAAVNKSGQLAVAGGLGLAPLHADLSLDLKGVDILPLQPYVTDKVNLLITRAALSTKGTLQVDQGGDGVLKGGFKGDVTLGNLATVDKLNANDLLRWKSLYVGGINVQLAPMSIGIDQIALSDFFARIIVDPSGRINLQDIARKESEAHKSLTEEGEAKPADPAMAAAPPAAAPAPAPSAAPASPPLPIRIRKVSLQGGAVKFTDNFIKPNYTANLLDLGGVITGLSADASTTATVDIRGEVNSAPLTIAGKVNPLKGDLFLDINAAVRGMELAPLSPYSGKYAGYGIEKGKLTFEVAYQLEHRKLNAQNRLILDQLTFGEKVDSPSATKLPVQLAVALLRDRNGVIDISLPIGGSLDDPQFSVGGIIVKVIVNVITKAIMAPFSLLGSLFGGGEELGWLEFDPGYAVVPAAGEAKLKSLTKALLDRPALKLEIAGRVDAETDREGLKRSAIDRKVKALKLKDLAGKGESSDINSIKVMPEEYPVLLARVYKDEKFPKPRNMIGLQKDLPVDEMEKLMVANGQASDDDLAALANQRAQVVKDWLVKTGQVPAERVFIVSGKGTTPSDKGKPNRVDFSLK